MDSCRQVWQNQHTRTTRLEPRLRAPRLLPFCLIPPHFLFYLPFFCLCLSLLSFVYPAPSVLPFGPGSRSRSLLRLVLSTRRNSGARGCTDAPDGDFRHADRIPVWPHAVKNCVDHDFGGFRAGPVHSGNFSAEPAMG